MTALLLLIIFSQIIYRALSKTNTDLATPLPLSQLFQMSGAASNDNFGVSVSNAGDFNNDGIDDIIVGAHMADPFTRSNAGLVYVIYGKQNGMKANADLSVPLSLSEGFWVAGCSSNDYLGTSVNPAGDVNKDGVDDIIIGANASPPSSDGGAAYVIFGKAGGSPGNLDLCNGLTQTQGFTIIGAVMGGLVGQSVNGAGDVNGDGYADVIVGGSKITPANGITSAGIAVVVYGKATAMIGDINLASTLPLSQGFMISGGAANGQLGFSVSSAGDINKDGYDDIIVGSPYCQAGATIIYGKSTGTAANIDLSVTLPLSQGFQILSVGAGDRLGRSVNKARDFNNDGIDDIIVGANLANSPNTGAAYVIYGKAGGMTSNIYLNSLTLSQGFSIQGAAGGDNTGYAVSYIGDVNKDGIDDVIVGAPGNSPSGRSGAGSAYVIYGKTGGMNANIDLSTPLILTQGFTVIGANPGDNLGFSAGAACDFNNDGIDDIIVGGHAASPLGRSGAGSAYVLYDPPYCSTLYCVTCAGSKCLACATDYLLYVGDGKCYTEYTCPSGTTPNATNCVDHLMESVGKAQGLASQGAALAASAISLVSFSNPVGLVFNSLAGILLYMKYMSITFSPRLQNILDQPDSSLLSIQYISSEPEQLDDNIPNLPLPDVFERNGFNSSFLINFWPSLINLLIICIVILVVCFAAWLTRDYRFINSKCKKVKEALKWNYFIASFAGCYGPIAFYSSFQFRTVQIDSLLEILSFIICLLMNIVLLAVSVKIFTVIRTLSQSKNHRKVEKVRQKFSEYQVIFENFKSQSFSQQNYLLFSCLRFYFFYSVLGYLFDYPVAQALLINIQGLAFLFYLLIARPLKSKLDLVESIILEFIIEVVHACVLGFAVINHQDPSATSKAITLGDTIIIAICVFMIVECIYMLIQIIGLMINLIKFIRKTFCLSRKSGIKQNVASKPLDESLSIDQTNDKQDTKIPSLTEKREFILPLKGAAFRRRNRNQMYAINREAWMISSTHATT